MSRDNPLTARTFVNRTWREFFGTGLSKVIDDLGSQGESPTHPELLDWLASEFMQKWDIKHVVRLIVTSHTYRQSSLAEAPRGRRRIRRTACSLTRIAFAWTPKTCVMSSCRCRGCSATKFGGPSVSPVSRPAISAR